MNGANASPDEVVDTNGEADGDTDGINISCCLLRVVNDGLMQYDELYDADAVVRKQQRRGTLKTRPQRGELQQVSKCEGELAYYCKRQTGGRAIKGRCIKRCCMHNCG